ncbi:MAG: hypothetical protein ABW047_01045 [Nitrospiraceae bacterium]
MRNAVLTACIAGGLAWAAGTTQAANEQTLMPLVTAIHVHSTTSTGTLDLDALAERAEHLGIEALLLSENLALQYEYGLQPLRGILKISLSFPSLISYGMKRYLKDVHDAQARHPRVLLIPGLEVAPHYYWTGSLWTRDLTMHDAQKNLLVFGLHESEDVAGLPALGNSSSYRYSPSALSGLLPALLVLPAMKGWYDRRRSSRMIDRSGRRRRRRIGAIVLAMSGVVLLFNGWPYSSSQFSPYDAAAGYQPYQTFIDAVNRRNGLVIWSLPEARDFHTVSAKGFGAVTIRTDSHPDALVSTAGYAGFGGLYQEARQATLPGGTWDQLIDQFVRGTRALRPSMIGEIAFHSPDHAGKELDQVLTVLWVRERTEAAVLEAVRNARGYAVERYHPDFRFVLETISLQSVDGSPRSMMGDKLLIGKGQAVKVEAKISTTDRHPHKLTMRLIRSGRVIDRLDGTTPLDYEFVDHAVPSDARSAYRLEVTGGQTGELLTNPIYVEVTAPKRPS